ncbi:MAG UNVERIFIED_CONTAM: hypothetical protein LVR29_19730 [Microcystis novacekii LVE1205-3]|jgi:putative DNA methylase
MRETFARQAIPMIWDFAEANPFCNSGGNFEMFINRSVDVTQIINSDSIGKVFQHDAAD